MEYFLSIVFQVILFAFLGYLISARFIFVGMMNSTSYYSFIEKVLDQVKNTLVFFFIFILFSMHANDMFLYTIQWFLLQTYIIVFAFLSLCDYELTYARNKPYFD
jgi:predicted Na+-dependent transporter